MTADMLGVALQGATAALDCAERIWLVGLARLTEVPETREVASEEVQQVIAMCQEMGTFPSGPVGYLPDGYRVDSGDGYRSVSLSSESAPHLEMKLGIGQAGFVALGLTRTGRFDRGYELPSGVLITDMESVMADVYILAIATTALLGHLGRVDMVFAVSGDGPGRTPSFYALDEDDGSMVCTGQLSSPLPPLRHSFELTPDTGAESIHLDLYAVARRFAQSVGAADAQLVTQSLGDQEAYRDNPLTTAFQRFRGDSSTADVS